MPLLSFSFGLKAKILASDFGFGIPQRMRCVGVNFHMASFVYHFAILFLGDFFFFGFILLKHCFKPAWIRWVPAHVIYVADNTKEKSQRLQPTVHSRKQDVLQHNPNYSFAEHCVEACCEVPSGHMLDCAFAFSIAMVTTTTSWSRFDEKARHLQGCWADMRKVRPICTIEPWIRKNPKTAMLKKLQIDT